MFNGFSHSVKGASHESRGIVCQDSSAFKVSESGKYAMCVVADGHGSKKHFRSNIGSQFAVEAMVETVEKFCADSNAFDENFPQNHKMIIKNIEKQMISVWNYKVKEHLKTNPVTDEEKSQFTNEEFESINPESYYGSTLISAVISENYCFGMQIGDGSLVAVFEDGDAVMPMVYDESAPANITSSVCNANAASMFNSFYVENKKPVAFYASTDGLYTSFGSDRDFLDYHLIITAQLKDVESFDKSVLKNLTKRSHYGTQDDISLSCVFNEDYIKSNYDELCKKLKENTKKG